MPEPGRAVRRAPSLPEATGAVGVAIVGAGLMGATHALSLSALPDRARVICVCDPRADRAAVVAETVGASVEPDLQAALNRPEVDAVVVCVPPHLHCSIVEVALAAEKHVFLEKPIATTQDDADAIVAMETAGRQILMVGHVLRFWAGYRAVHAHSTSGDLGRARVVNTFRLQPPAPWGDAWIRDPSVSGGIAPLVMIHDLDQINWILGTPIEVSAHALTGSGASSQHVLAVVTFERGIGVAEASTTMPPSFPFASNIRVLCDRGAVEFAFNSSAPKRLEDAGDGDAEGQSFAPVEEPQVRVYGYDSEQPFITSISESDLWSSEMIHFLECIENESAPEHGSADQARDALAVALAVNRSLENGTPIRL